MDERHLHNGLLLEVETGGFEVSRQGWMLTGAPPSIGKWPCGNQYEERHLMTFRF